MQVGQAQFVAGSDPGLQVPGREPGRSVSTSYEPASRSEPEGNQHHEGGEVVSAETVGRCSGSWFRRGRISSHLIYMGLFAFVFGLPGVPIPRPSCGVAPGGRQSDRGDAGGGAGGDDLGGRLVAEAIVGDESDAEWPAFEELGVAAEAAAEFGQVLQGPVAESQALEVAEVIGLGTDEQVVLQVGVNQFGTLEAAPGLRPRWARPRRVAGSSRSTWVSADGARKVRMKKARSWKAISSIGATGKATSSGLPGRYRRDGAHRRRSRRCGRSSVPPRARTRSVPYPDRLPCSSFGASGGPPD